MNRKKKQFVNLESEMKYFKTMYALAEKLFRDCNNVK